MTFLTGLIMGFVAGVIVTRYKRIVPFFKRVKRFFTTPK
jgi:hypothetical protein